MFSGGAGRCLWDIWSDPWTVHWGASWGVPAQLLREVTGIPLKGHSRTWYRFFQEQVDIMMCEGFSGHQLISQLHDHTVQYFINQWCLNIAMSTRHCLGGKRLFEWPAEICNCWTPCSCRALPAWGRRRVSSGMSCISRGSNIHS